MRLFAQAGYFACDYCRTSHFPSPSPDGVRQFGEAPEGWRCSLCNQILHRISVDDRYQGHQCPRCQGLLLARPAFGDTVHTRRLWAGGPTDPPRSQDSSELHRAVDCPACGQRMQTHPYYGPGMLIIDTCDRCNLIWLDRGELARAVNAPGADRGAARVRVVAKDENQKAEKKSRRGRLDLIHMLDDLFG